MFVQLEFGTINILSENSILDIYLDHFQELYKPSRPLIHISSYMAHNQIPS